MRLGAHFATVVLSCHLTIELSGQARRHFRTGPRTHTCAHGAATMLAGPLQRIVRSPQSHQKYHTFAPFRDAASFATDSNP